MENEGASIMKKNSFLMIVMFLLSASLFAQKQELKTDYFKKGKIHIVNSSHQDIAWVNEPDVCRKDRADLIMLPLLERMKENPEMCFSVESGMYLQEFLEQYPEKYNEVLKYTREGRLEWGATYSQPYHELYDSEALTRQAYLGKKDLMKILPGCDFRSAWNVDVPGMAPQFPQIMSKAGIPYYNLSRFKTGFYEWFSPDGSSIKVVSTGQYSGYSSQVVSQKTDTDKTNALIGIVNYWGDYQKTRKISPAVLALISQDCTRPINYDTLITNWNNHKQKDLNDLPFMQYSTSAMFFDHLTENPKAKFDKVEGARPNMWLYIHGPTHHRAVAAAREASRTLVAAEMFSSFDAMLGAGFNKYPQERLHDAWKNAIFADHGWGGYKGVKTDRFFREKFEMARDTSAVILSEAVRNIADKIKFNKENLYAVTLFNSLSWTRTDPVSFTLNAEGRNNNFLKIIDENGKDVPFQFIDDHSFYGNNDEVLTFAFVATEVPAMGYKTYYVVEDKVPTTSVSKVNIPVYENKYFRMTLGNGGIESLYDKELKEEVFNTAKFKAAEIFTMKSEGTGAGEFSEIQQPTMDGFDKLSNYNTPWTCIESGNVRDVFQTSTQFKDVVAKLRVVMYKNMKKIDVEVDLNAYVGENWREYRLAFPFQSDMKKVAYDLHYGAVEVGVDEMDGLPGTKTLQPAYDLPASTAHPREVQDWFSISNNKRSLTISSDVAVFDWIDPTDLASSNFVLQPILLSSRRSCHGLGNAYLQPGNHSFRFSLYSHEGSWKDGYKRGSQQNRPLIVAVTPKEQANGNQLPSQMNFAKMDRENVLISSIKKCEDDNSLIVRMFDMERKYSNFSFNIFKSISSAVLTNLIEEEKEEINANGKEFKYNIGKSSIETFKLKTE